MESKINKTYLLTLSFIAALGGFLFGYDTAVISGTIGMVREQFGLSPTLEGWFVSSALFGCIAGVSVAGYLSDKFGRKNMLIASALLFSISALGCMISESFTQLIIYRIIGGMGVGVASMLSPLYISEISPPDRRGRMVTLYQFAITIGILCSYFANAWLLDLSGRLTPAPDSLVGFAFKHELWRGMFGAETIPAAMFLVLLIFVPKSPRWLVVKNMDQKAYNILARIAGDKTAEKEIREIRKTVSMEKGSWKMLFQPGIRTAVFIGIALSLMAQFTGINAIIYYGPRILEEAGFAFSDALGGQVIIGIVNVLFTLVAIWKIDQLGRRPLLIAGATGIIISLIIIGLLFFFEITGGYILLIFILIFIACFAFSFGPVVWVTLSEIYPTKIRGRAMSIGTMATWLGTAFVGQMVPILLGSIGSAGTFWLFAVLCSPAIYLALRIIPETKGKSLEEIEQYWMEKSS